MVTFQEACLHPVLVRVLTCLLEPLVFSSTVKTDIFYVRVKSARILWIFQQIFSDSFGVSYCVRVIIICPQTPGRVWRFLNSSPDSDTIDRDYFLTDWPHTQQ